MAELLGRHWRSCGTSWTKFIWSFFGAWMGRSTKLGRHVCSSKTRVISVSVCGCHQNGWKEVEYGFHVWEIDEKRWSWRTNFISWPCIFGMYSTWMQTQWNNCWTIKKMFESRIPAGATEKLPWWWGPHAKTVAWSYDMEGHARKCVKRYCELANKKMEQLSKVSSPCLDDHQFKQGELESVGELSEVCSQIVLKCLYLARIGRPDISMVSEQYCSFSHQMDRSFWPTFRLVDFIHLSHEWLSSILSCGKHSSALQIGFVPRLWLCLRPWRLEINLRMEPCIFRSRTFVTIRWMCKKRTSVSYSSTESEIISLDAGLRMDGPPALGLWDKVIEFFKIHNQLGKDSKSLIKCQMWINVPTNSHSFSQGES